MLGKVSLPPEKGELISDLTGLMGSVLWRVPVAKEKPAEVERGNTTNHPKGLQGDALIFLDFAPEKSCMCVKMEGDLKHAAYGSVNVP